MGRKYIEGNCTVVQITAGDAQAEQGGAQNAADAFTFPEASLDYCAEAMLPDPPQEEESEEDGACVSMYNKRRKLAQKRNFVLLSGSIFAGHEVYQSTCGEVILHWHPDYECWSETLSSKFKEFEG